MATRALAQIEELDVTAIEAVIAKGDLAQLSPEERVNYYVNTCRSLGLNPFTKPFDFLNLGGKVVMYANRGATDQLRDVHGVNIIEVTRERTDEMMIVTATAQLPDGRRDTATGIVWIKSLAGDNLVNAIMKAETKAKRRVTLSICGLGWMDETETETVRGARRAPEYLEEIDEDTARYRHFQRHGPLAGMGLPWTEAQQGKLFAEARDRHWHKDQIYGRATEIEPRVADEGLHALDHLQMSHLITAVINERPWVDPRQSNMDIDAVIDATAREVPSSDEPPIDPETGEILDEPDGCWDLDGSFIPPRVSGDPEADLRMLHTAAREAFTREGLADLWRFIQAVGFSDDPELKGAVAARRRELGGNGNGSNQS